MVSRRLYHSIMYGTMDGCGRHSLELTYQWRNRCLDERSRRGDIARFAQDSATKLDATIDSNYSETDNEYFYYMIYRSMKYVTPKILI